MNLYVKLCGTLYDRNGVSSFLKMDWTKGKF